MNTLSLKHFLHRFDLYLYLSYSIKKIIVKINPIKEINRCYKIVFGKLPNLTNPKNFVEKVYWMEWNTDTTLWSLCADKYRVREYLQSCNLEYLSPKLYAKWDNPDEIDLSSLPNEFVLKTNDGCGTNLIVHDKNTLQLKSIKRKFKRFLKYKEGYNNAQFHYLDIKPCIIAEELLHQSESEKQISPNSLIDYKLFCINGQVECILVVYDRTSSIYGLQLFDTNWTPLDYLNPNGHYKKDNQLIDKPKCLEEMIAYAQRLSKPFIEVRVDFYIIDDKPVFGELTFSPGYGNFKEEYYDYLGSKMDITQCNVVSKHIK